MKNWVISLMALNASTGRMMATQISITRATYFVSPAPRSAPEVMTESICSGWNSATISITLAERRATVGSSVNSPTSG